MSDASLRGDCSRCVGLCCVALAFDRGPHFAFDKSGGEPCRHLDAADRCALHDRLDAAGLPGCVAYDCRGAGQIATALFGGLSWRDSPAVARQMFAAFAMLRQIQMLRCLFDPRDQPTLHALLSPPVGWSLATLLTFDIAAARAAVGVSLALSLGQAGAAQAFDARRKA